MRAATAKRSTSLRWRASSNIAYRLRSIGIDGRPSSAEKYARYGSKNTGSSNKASTRANRGGNCSYPGGSSASHSVRCGFVVTSIPTPIHHKHG